MQGPGHGLPAPSFSPEKSSMNTHGRDGSPSTNQPFDTSGLTRGASLWISFSNGLLQGGDAAPCTARGEKVRVFLGLKHSHGEEGGETPEWLFPVRWDNGPQRRQAAGSLACPGRTRSQSCDSARSALLHHFRLNSFVSWWHKVRS